MKSAIGEGMTRKDHSDASNSLYAVRIYASFRRDQCSEPFFPPPAVRNWTGLRKHEGCCR